MEETSKSRYNRNYYETHKEQFREYARNYYYRNKHKIVRHSKSKQKHYYLATELDTNATQKFKTVKALSKFLGYSRSTITRRIINKTPIENYLIQRIPELWQE